MTEVTSVKGATPHSLSPAPPHLNLTLVSRYPACTKDGCSPATGAAQASLLSALTRTLTWALTVPEDAMAELSLIGDGLTEAGAVATASCPDGSTYVLTQTTPDGGPANRTYCRGGSTTVLTLPGGGALTLILGPGVEAPPTVFSVSVKPLSTSTSPCQSKLRTGVFKGPL